MLRREALLLLGGGPLTSVASLSAARPPRLGETYDAAARLGKRAAAVLRAFSAKTLSRGYGAAVATTGNSEMLHAPSTAA